MNATMPSRLLRFAVSLAIVPWLVVAIGSSNAGAAFGCGDAEGVASERSQNANERTAVAEAAKAAANTRVTVPKNVLFFDDFEYVAGREDADVAKVFIKEGGWNWAKTQHSSKGAKGYLYTTERIPGYAGPFPGRNSKRVLAIEARSKTFHGQTDFYLQYGNGRGPADQVPGNVWFQFWLYVNYYDDPQDQEDQLSGFGRGKFIYPSVDGNYPTHPVWLLCVGRRSHVLLKDHDKPFFAEVASHDLLLQIPVEGGAEIKKAAPWNRWKLGQTSLDERIVANRWTLVKVHIDTSTTSGSYEAWMKPFGGKWVKVVEWIDGVTPDFSWKIPEEKVGGYKVFRMPTTHGSFGERAKDNSDSWIYMDDFAMAGAEEELPVYPN